MPSYIAAKLAGYREAKQHKRRRAGSRSASPSRGSKSHMAIQLTSYSSKSPSIRYAVACGSHAVLGHAALLCAAGFTGEGARYHASCRFRTDMQHCLLVCLAVTSFAKFCAKKCCNRSAGWTSANKFAGMYHLMRSLLHCASHTGIREEGTEAAWLMMQH